MNKYLEKIARNKFEDYLLSQPEGKVYDRPEVTRAAKNLHSAARIQRNSHAMHELGAKPEAVERMAAEAKDIIREHRGQGSPFKATTRKGLESSMRTNHVKNKFLGKAETLGRKTKIGLGVAGALAVGAGAYGVYKDVTGD